VGGEGPVNYLRKRRKRSWAKKKARILRRFGGGKTKLMGDLEGESKSTQIDTGIDARPTCLEEMQQVDHLMRLFGTIVVRSLNCCRHVGLE
jgi:hypothetical protein